MKIGGYRTLSTVDFPGRVVATIFIVGCNFYCEYCHNHQFISENGLTEFIDIEEIFLHLKKRQNILDGICITGGEPLLHFDEIKSLIKRIKSEFPHFMIKLDTNGSSLEKIEKILPYIDFISVDFKGNAFKKYSNYSVDIESIIEILNRTGILYELRLTMYPDYFPIEDFESVAERLKRAKNISIQQYNSENAWVKKENYSLETLELFADVFKKKGIITHIR